MSRVSVAVDQGPEVPVVEPVAPTKPSKSKSSPEVTDV